MGMNDLPLVVYFLKYKGHSVIFHFHGIAILEKCIDIAQPADDDQVGVDDTKILPDSADLLPGYRIIKARGDFPEFIKIPHDTIRAECPEVFYIGITGKEGIQLRTR